MIDKVELTEADVRELLAEGMRRRRNRPVRPDKIEIYIDSGSSDPRELSQPHITSVVVVLESPTQR